MDRPEVQPPQSIEFRRLAGQSKEEITEFAKEKPWRLPVAPIPLGFHVIEDGASLHIGGRDWKVHFVVQNNGWSGAKERLNAPLLFNLRQDPLERTEEESGMYVQWIAHSPHGGTHTTRDWLGLALPSLQILQGKQIGNS